MEFRVGARKRADATRTPAQLRPLPDWSVLSRNGRPPPPWERCLKETFFLDHEDHGLMSQFEVVAPGG